MLIMVMNVMVGCVCVHGRDSGYRLWLNERAASSKQQPVPKDFISRPVLKVVAKVHCWVVDLCC